MTTNQVVFGLACGSIGRVARERQLGDDAAAVRVDHLALMLREPCGPFRPPMADPEARDLHAGMPPVRRSAPWRDSALRRARCGFARIVLSGCANFVREK